MTGVCALCGRLQSVRSVRGSSIKSARCHNDGAHLLSIQRARKLLGVQRLDELSESERALAFSMLGPKVVPEAYDRG